MDEMSVRLDDGSGGFRGIFISHPDVFYTTIKLGESEQHAENKRTAGWMRCPSGWMTGRVQGRLATSFTIYDVLKQGLHKNNKQLDLL
jgi:hypothetical protein